MSKLNWQGIDRLLAQFPPNREPDSLYMTEGLREKIREAVEPLLVAKAEVPGYRFHGMEIHVYPVGTVIFNKKTGQRGVIDENSVLSAIRADVVILEPHRIALADANTKTEPTP